MEEAVDVLCGGSGILALEETRRNVEYASLRIALLDAMPMAWIRCVLPTPEGPKTKKRVEGFERWVVAYGLTYRAGNLVAFAETVVLESVSGH